MAAILFEIAWYVTLWTNFGSDRENIAYADFSHLYNAGRLARAGEWSHIYNLDYQMEVQSQFTGKQVEPNKFLRFNHPPVLVPLLALFSVDDITLAYKLWNIVLIVLMAFNSWLNYQLLREEQFSIPAALLAALSVLLFYPTFVSILKGQDTVFLLLGATLWMYGLLKKKDFLSGTGLGMTVVRPQFALMLSIPFMTNRRRIWKSFFMTASLLTVYSIAMIGKTGISDFIETLSANASGVAYGLNKAAMFNIIGSVLRVVPDANETFVQILEWAIYAVAIFGLVLLWKKSGQLDNRHIGVAAIFYVLATPHLHYHDLSLLLLPIIGAVMLSQRKNLAGGQVSVFLPLMISLGLLLFDLTSAYRFYFVYIIEIALLLFLWPSLDEKMVK